MYCNSILFVHLTHACQHVVVHLRESVLETCPAYYAGQRRNNRPSSRSWYRGTGSVTCVTAVLALSTCFSGADRTPWRRVRTAKENAVNLRLRIISTSIIKTSIFQLFPQECWLTDLDVLHARVSGCLFIFGAQANSGRGRMEELSTKYTSHNSR